MAGKGQVGGGDPHAAVRPMNWAHLLENKSGEGIDTRGLLQAVRG